jgi:NADH:ubiquinone oxidoreductase subunit K
VNGEAVAVLVYAASVVAGAAGIYGILAARNLVKLLVSLELLFNSVVVSASYVGSLVGHEGRHGFYTLLIPVILLTLVEMTILLAIVVLVYRTHGGVETSGVGETRG